MHSVADHFDFALAGTPDAPNLTEFGVNFPNDTMFMLAGPPGMDPAARDAIAAAVAEVLTAEGSKAGGFINKAFGGVDLRSGAELDAIIAKAYADAEGLLKASSEQAEKPRAGPAVRARPRHPSGGPIMTPHSRSNLLVGLFFLAFAAAVAFVWIPLDVDTGLFERVRRRIVIGDALAPTVAATFVALGAIVLILFERKAPRQPAIRAASLRFIGLQAAILLVGFLIMRHRAALESEPADPKFADVRKAYSRIPPQTDEQLREIIANTYGQIAFIDHQIGRILIALQELGLDDNIIVIYISDHGDWLGDHGLVLKGPMHFEGLLKVLMIVKGPGVPSGKVVGEPVSTLDLGATFCDYAATEPLLPQHGASLHPLIEGDAKRDFALNEWGLGAGRVGVPLELRTVRTRRHKLTVDLNSGAGELYDLAADPHELVNLFDDPAAAETRATLEGYVATRPNDMLPDQPRVGTA